MQVQQVEGSKVGFKPFHDRVLVKQAEVDETHAGKIVIPDSQKEKPLEGLVVAVGPGKVEWGGFVSPACQVGDTVLFGKYAGAEITVDGEEYLLLRDEEVLGRRTAAAKSDEADAR